MEKGGHLAFMLDASAGAREKVAEFIEQHNSQ
jgi:hypothetical protein